ncbi:ABC transporter ATP-binding protein [Nocardiopsis lambiniae]|uniref:ABC transporter ATP-binding protein n=1 Tax=Nocardiopsis lambiniae TaxID=3075539 RepID=A0ABU2MBQ8_9ACTN|nr:ABC transporter ATP-binding protein [Nocardiopsis sp. DSM 44743]MDT0329997.1 ABC transporter ATP-binding protein [Nocardiopsis sp. DSM 44743]
MSSGPDESAPRDGMGPRTTCVRALHSLEIAWRAAPWSLALYSALTVVAGVLPAGVTLVTKWLLDILQAGDGAGGVPGPLVEAPLLLVVFLGVFTLVSALSEYVLTYLSSRLKRAVALLVQQRLYGAVNRIAGLRRFEDPAFLDRLRMAQTSATTAPEEILGSLFGTVRWALTITGFLGILLTISPVITAITVASALPMLFVQMMLNRERAGMLWQMSPRMRRQMFYQQLMLDPAAIKETRLFGAGGFLLGRMRGELLRINDAEERLDRKMVLTHGPLALLGALVSAGGLVWMVAGALRGEFTIGDVAAFIAAVAGVQSSLGGIVGSLTGAYQALLLMGHYQDVVSTPSDLPVPADPRPLARLREGIEVEDVWFRYTDDGPWVLKGVSLTIPAQGSLALVGLNGAGKSTLVKLLCRMYDPTRGRVLWDGTDIREVDLEALRNRMSAVFQDFMSYELPVRENIALGALEDRDDGDRVREAARTAGADGFIEEMPHGYDTVLSRVFYQSEDGDGDTASGTTLSGGQWQKLAIARSLMRRGRDLLIVDEPTSGLDPEAERRVQDQLRTLRDGAATVMISHRLGAVRGADRIVVLQDGVITERGDHGELMGRGGEYARLFSLQAEGYTGGDASGAPPAEPDEVMA